MSTRPDTRLYMVNGFKTKIIIKKKHANSTKDFISVSRNLFVFYSATALILYISFIYSSFMLLADRFEVFYLNGAKTHIFRSSL